MFFLEQDAEKGEKNTGSCFSIESKAKCKYLCMSKEKIVQTNFPLGRVFNQALHYLFIVY